MGYSSSPLPLQAATLDAGGSGVQITLGIHF